MGCNAWNHSPDCSCGWGGVFYGSAYRGEVSGNGGHWQRYQSYTTPNARCPECQAQVFFYLSPYGGRVYFDDLGPPWPKHPCTDTSSTRTRARPGQALPAATRRKPPPTIRRDPGWRPLLVEKIARHETRADVVLLTVHPAAGDAPVILYAVVDRQLLDHRTPFLGRRGEDGSIEVSTLNALLAVPAELRFTAFSSPERLPPPPQPTRASTAAPVPASRTWMRPAQVPTLAPVRPSVKVKTHRPDRQVQITYKPAPPPTPPAPAAKAAPPQRKAPPAAPPPPVAPPPPRRPATAPLTSMALAFQKVAAASPEAEELLIRGFRKERKP